MDLLQHMGPESLFRSSVSPLCTYHPPTTGAYVIEPRGRAAVLWIVVVPRCPFCGLTHSYDYFACESIFWFDFVVAPCNDSHAYRLEPMSDEDS